MAKEDFLLILSREHNLLCYPSGPHTVDSKPPIDPVKNFKTIRRKARERERSVAGETGSLLLGCTKSKI